MTSQRSTRFSATPDEASSPQSWSVRMATTNPTQARALLPVGTVAPDFTLNSTPDQKVSLSDFRGRPVVLVFYPADWSPVCGDQVALYNEMLSEFAEANAQLLG